MPKRQDRTAGGFDQAALTGTPTAPVETRSAHRGQGHVLREPLSVLRRYLPGPLGERTRWTIGITMRDSDRAWVAPAGGVAAYDLIATDEQVTNAARRHFKSQPIVRVDDPGDRPSTSRRPTAVVRLDHADVRRVVTRHVRAVFLGHDGR
jgi:hypothetical protein